jgi:hypothetical protein
LHFCIILLSWILLQNLKRESGHDIGQDVPEGPPLPPTNTHPLYSPHGNEEGNCLSNHVFRLVIITMIFSDGSYLASSADPPAVSFYPTQRPGQNSQGHFPPNPWEREERERVHFDSNCV